MHTTHALDRTVAPAAPRAVTLAVRVVGAALLLAMGAIHLKLWFDGYRDIAWIGPLFLANAVLSVLAAAAVLLTPFAVGTLGGLVLSLTVGLFGFFESVSAPLVVPTIVVESAAFLLLSGFGVWRLWSARQEMGRARG
jgi:hypothetical protein